MATGLSIAATAISAATLAISPPPANAVVGGTPTTDFSTTPFVGSYEGKYYKSWDFLKHNPGHEWCGTTLIAPGYAITAAHCIADHGVGSVDMTLRFYPRSGVTESSGVTSYTIAPNSAPHNDVNDMAVLKLNTPITDITVPVMASACPDWSIGSSMFAIGWGQSGLWSDNHNPPLATATRATLAFDGTASWFHPDRYFFTVERQGTVEFGDSGDGLFYRRADGSYEMLGLLHRFLSATTDVGIVGPVRQDVWERTDVGSANWSFVQKYALGSAPCPPSPPPPPPPPPLNPNQPPFAAFTLARNVGAPSTYTVNASASRDPDGTIAAYNWYVGTTAAGTGRTATLSLAFKSASTVKLIVTDNQNATGTATQTVTVRDRAPTVTSVLPSGVVASTTPTLSAVTSDPDGEALRFDYQVTGPSVSANSGWITTGWAIPAHTLDPGTTYQYAVTAEDPEGLTATRTGQFTVAMLPAAADVLSTPDGRGYWQVASDGGVFCYGDAEFYGSVPGVGVHTNTIVGMARTPDGDGYWLVGSDGGVFAFGDAGFYGSLPGLNVGVSNIVGMAVTKTGSGYWLVGNDGGVFAFGDAGFYGSKGGQPLNAPVVGIAATPSGNGYWLAAADGGVFAYGDAPFYGSLGGQTLNAPVTDLDVSPDGLGYWLAAEDGGVFAFGDAGFYGSMAGHSLNGHVTGMAATPDGRGYWLTGCDGGVFAFGDATFYGSNPTYECRGVAGSAHFALRNLSSSRCLDADLNTIGGNGTTVQLWDCNGQPQQSWAQGPDGSIRDTLSGRCLDADLNTIGGNGTTVQLWDCNGQPQQSWILGSDGSLRNVASGRVLDADLNTIGGNGTRVQLWDPNGQPQQGWHYAIAA